MCDHCDNIKMSGATVLVTTDRLACLLKWMRDTATNLGIQAKKPKQAQESMALFDVISYVAQSCTPGPNKVLQVRGNALGTDPGNTTKRDGTAQPKFKA